MPRFLAALALTLAACGQGVEPQPEDPVSSSSQPDAVLLAQREPRVSPAHLRRVETEVLVDTAQHHLVGTAPPASGLQVDVAGPPEWNGLAVVGLVAVPSCGWWPIARADAISLGGQLSFAFNPKQNVGQLGGSNALFLYVDHDGDGACDEAKGDEVFEATLGALAAGAQVSVATSDLRAASYSCSLFSYLP